MRGLDGKVVVVTGGGGGIGGATARRFAAEGAQTAVLDVDLEAARAVANARKIRRMGSDHHSSCRCP